MSMSYGLGEDWISPALAQYVFFVPRYWTSPYREHLLAEFATHTWHWGLDEFPLSSHQVCTRFHCYSATHLPNKCPKGMAVLVILSYEVSTYRAETISFSPIFLSFQMIPASSSTHHSPVAALTSPLWGERPVLALRLGQN